jgi:RND family efflux transporter MFP subunit
MEAPSDSGALGKTPHDTDQIPSDLPKFRTRSAVIAAFILVLALAGLFVLGWIPRHKRLASLEQQVSAQDNRPIVEIVKVSRKLKPFDLWLPADLRSMQDTSIYPRANGYLARLLVDIGSQVQAGQLLAEIDTPEINADLKQTQANLVQAQANLRKSQDDYRLAESTLKRYEEVGPTGGVTQQDLDEKRGALAQAKSQFEAAEANVSAMRATVERLTAQQGFGRITAPFAGVITARNYDVGALLVPTSAASGKPLFRLEEIDTLKVSVNVPQSYVDSVKIGQQVALSVRNFPGREFKGTVARSAGALDPSARTLRFEIDVPNKEGVLFSGMYGQVRLPVTQQHPPIMLPTSALVFDSAGIHVWVMDGDTVRSRKVEVGRDFGTEVEVASGISTEDSVVSNPGERLVDGESVTVLRPEPLAGGDPAPAPSTAPEARAR